MIESLKWVASARGDKDSGMYATVAWYPKTPDSAGRGLLDDGIAGYLVATDKHRMHVCAIGEGDVIRHGLDCAVSSAVDIVKTGTGYRAVPSPVPYMSPQWWKCLPEEAERIPAPDLMLDHPKDAGGIIPRFMFQCAVCFNYTFLAALAGEAWSVWMPVGGGITKGKAMVFIAQGARLVAAIMPLQIE